MKSKTMLLTLLVFFVAFSLQFACAKKQVSTDSPDAGAETTAQPEDTTGGEDFADTGTQQQDVDASALKLSAVYFDFDQASLSSDARQTLRDHYNALQSHEGIKVIVEGHCDDRGTAADGDHLQPALLAADRPRARRR